MVTFRTRTVVGAAAVAGVAVLTTAGPASAHTPLFGRQCGSVTLQLVHFGSSTVAPNVVSVFRDGVKIDTVTFTTPSTVRSYPETGTGPVSYRVSWSHTGPDHASATISTTLPVPARCAKKTATLPLPLPAGGGGQPPLPVGGLGPAQAAGQPAAQPAAAITSAPPGLAPFVIGAAVALALSAGVGSAVVLRRRRRLVPAAAPAGPPGYPPPPGQQPRYPGDQLGHPGYDGWPDVTGR